ncbi:unnamed protein product, partial [Effrenium voratum]
WRPFLNVGGEPCDPWQLMRRQLHQLPAVLARLPAPLGRWRSLSMALGEDPYKILGVHPGASPEELRAAYLKAALRTHPDSTEDEASNEAFSRVAEAYQRLRTWRPGAVHPRVRSSPLSGVDGRPPFTSVSYEQAERLFRAAFAGRGVDDMLDEELTRINIKPGVHTAVVKQGIYARLLRAAQAASQLAPRDKAQVGSAQADEWPRLEVQRENVLGKDGRRWVRVRTVTRWPNGRKEEHTVEKPVYKL